MESDNSKHEDKPPASASLLPPSELRLPGDRNRPATSGGIGSSAGVNSLPTTFPPFPSISMPVMPEYYTGGFLSTSSNLNTEVPHSYNPHNFNHEHESNLPFPEGNINAYHPHYTHVYPMHSRDGTIASYHGPNPYDFNQFETLNGSLPSNLQMMRQGGVNISSSDRPQLVRNSISCRGGESMLCHTPDSKRIETNGVTPDRRLLELRGNAQAISERISKNQMIGIPQSDASHRQTVNRVSSYPSPYIPGYPSGFQNNMGRFIMPSHNIFGGTFPNNNQRVVPGTNSRSFPNSTNIIQMPQSNEERQFFMPSTRNLGSGNGGDRNLQPLRNPNGSFKGYPALESFQNFPSESSMSFSPNVVIGRTYPQDQSGNFVNPQATNHLIQTYRNLAEPATTGQQNPITKVNRTSPASSVPSGHSLKRDSAQAAPTTFQNPRRKIRTPSSSPAIPTFPFNALCLQNLSETASHSVLSHTTPSFPLQANSNTEFSNNPPSSLFPQDVGTNQRLNSQTLAAQPTLSQLQGAPPRPFLPQIAPAQARAQAQAQALRQSQSLAQIQEQLQAVESHSQNPPSRAQQLARLKALIQGRVQALASQSQNPPSRAKPSRPHTASPKVPPHETASTLRIKWEGAGADQTQPLGHKCLICKRDLSFTPEGPVSLPSPPPIVAVLPCGHTFHDHCLNVITPHDQAKDPPCIPCALGEN